MAEPESSQAGRRRLAVVGYPVGHSRSPAMQQAALDALGLADEWEYGAIDLHPDGFEAGIHQLAEAGFAGVNVTVPHKEAALRIADSASSTAGEIGAANTLSFPGGRVEAENTDGPALTRFLADGSEGRTGLVLGAGGAARAAVWALSRAGAEVSVWNRTASRAAELATESGVEAVESFELGAFDVVVNASAAGLGGSDPFEDLPLDPAGFRPGQLVIDMVYGEGPGRLLGAASEGGASTVDGIDVLVAQGALSLRIWTGLDPPLDVMEQAARAA